MRMQFLAKIAIAGLAMAYPFASMANDWYAGISLGQAENKTRQAKITGSSFSGTIDNEDSAWKIFGGYRLWDEYVAVEVSYIDLGTTKATGTSSGSAYTGTHELETFTLGLTGRIPITDPLGVIIHLGFSRNESKLTTTTGSTGTFAGATDTEFFAGLGLQYEFSDTIGARIELEQFVVDAYKVNFLSAGIIYRF
ncbi:MAG: outer membrane beta-barrel protein [Sulfuricaulis sp.]|uniref:outer membrane beta-barrel protein n=1 Tax=Sulfuricaulis sp. TaxID=2003553 RepID=UPI0025DCD26A|nr:outer membrane beta-barrel protein [Sulfuricaulis sp.]MCR4346370.1 outer membrane beta-barrel protein [Sulfuricaulis sp.]